MDALLAARVTVLDVGRVPLGPELCVVDIGHPYGRVLELGTRLGAQFVTVRAGAPGRDGTTTDPTADPAEFFARLAELAGRYHLRPLLSLAAGTAVATLEQALDVVEGTGGGVVLDVVPGRDTAPRSTRPWSSWASASGYVRVAARALPHTAAPGLLATLPPQVPVAIGGSDRAGHDASAPHSVADGRPAPDQRASAGSDADEPRRGTGTRRPRAQVARVSALRRAVDGMLRHPQATAAP